MLALEKFNLDIPQGKIIAFLGPNGSGKTTALKMIIGDVKPSKGKVSFFNHDHQISANSIQKNIGYVSQQIELDQDVSGREILSLFIALYGIKGKEKIKKIEVLMKDFGLEKHINHKVKSYSGGLKQRLHIALSVINNPDFLLLDEPTNSLDPEARKDIWNKILDYKNKGVIIITHDLIEAAQYCDYIVLFDSGKLLAKGTPEEIINSTDKVMWQIYFRGNIKPNTIKLVSKINGVFTVVSMNQKIVLSVDESRLNEKAITEVLEEFVDILEIRKQSPSITTAYFNITGKIIDDKINTKKKKA
ncbi:MAG: ABC transporter ATP-binding protein [Psychroserpens sp.]|nr:ABC transporter ATP-binding protein [Psychroserpens sp.]